MKNKSKVFGPAAGHMMRRAESHTLAVNQIPVHDMGAHIYTPTESNEMRLLRCLCDALGYDVKVTFSHSTSNPHGGIGQNHFSYQLIKQSES